jgi:hypothetical protein
MKRYSSLLSLAFVIQTAICAAQSHKLTIIPESSILIKGNSNVNKFIFTYDQVIKPLSSTIKIEQHKNIIYLKNAAITMDVAAFHSGNRLMDRDYQHMMNYKTYPYIFIELHQIKPISEDNENLLAIMSLSIAGEKRLDTLNFSYNKSRDIYRCNTTHQLSLKDYKIKPLKKMMGLISLKDLLVIEIILYLKVD